MLFTKGSLTPLIRTFGSALDGNVALGGSFHVLGVAPFAFSSHPAAETSATIRILGVDLLVSQKVLSEKLGIAIQMAFTWLSNGWLSLGRNSAL